MQMRKRAIAFSVVCVIVLLTLEIYSSLSLESLQLPRDKNNAQDGVAVVKILAQEESKETASVTKSAILSKDDESKAEGSKSTSFIGYGSVHTNTSPSKQLATFLKTLPNTPGAKFVSLLREHLHNFEEADAEANRLISCRGDDGPSKSSLCYGGTKRFYEALQKDPKYHCWGDGSRKASLCYGGTKRYYEAVQASYDYDYKLKNQKNKQDKEELERMTQFGPFNTTVYEIQRFQSRYVIPALGTWTACLPLALAAAAITQDPKQQIAIELGPFAGQSSKCIVAGLPRDVEYHAFDTFDGWNNFKAIHMRAEWTHSLFPDYNKNQTSFFNMWKSIVREAKPDNVIHGTAGYINKTSLNPTVLNHKQVALISIDSAKKASHLKTQLEGIGTIAAGTILFLMDFEWVSDQIKQVFGCFRSNGYLLPVYISWNMEHWAFIVLKDFDIRNSSLIQKNCYKDIPQTIAMAEHILNEDLKFVSGGLSDDAARQESMAEHRNSLFGSMKTELNNKPFEWKRLLKGI